MTLANKTIVLGVTGGVAAFKACELVRLLTAQGAAVHVVMTQAATQFIGPATFQALSGNKVWLDQWDASVPNNMAHIELTRSADCVLIAPASADFMSKLAHGSADDLLSTLCLARDCPLLIAPAMNKQMWENPATVRNAATLTADGITLLGPTSGDQACGEVGMGRMLEASALYEDLVGFFTPKLLTGKRVLITAGPTFEAIDPVRGITNHSSGKMGYAIARACAQAGASVRLVSGPTAQTVPRHVQITPVQSALQMHAAVMQQVAGADIFIAVAAVADWRPKQMSTQKIKKNGASPNTRSDANIPCIALVENPDILADVARLPKAPWCVGFAAESEALEKHGQAKRQRKGIPLLVANIGHETFGKDDNTLLLIDDAGLERLPRASKIQLASELVKAIAKRLPTKRISTKRISTKAPAKTIQSP